MRFFIRQEDGGFRMTLIRRMAELLRFFLIWQDTILTIKFKLSEIQQPSILIMQFSCFIIWQDDILPYDLEKNDNKNPKTQKLPPFQKC